MNALPQVLLNLLLFSLRATTSIDIITNITKDKMMLHQLETRETTRQRKIKPKLRLHYQYAMVTTEYQELTAEWQSRPNPLLNKMAMHQLETRETQQPKRTIPPERLHYHHVLPLQRDPLQALTAEELFHCAAILQKALYQELIADLQQGQGASLRDKIISFKLLVMIRKKHLSTQDQMDSTSQSFQSALV